MSKISIEFARNNTSTVIKTLHDKLKILKVTLNEYMPAARALKTAEFKQAASAEILGMVNKFQREISEHRSKVQKALSDESRVYNPTMATQQQEYLLKKLVMLPRLQSMNLRQLNKLYSDTSDPIDKQILEDEIGWIAETKQTTSAELSVKIDLLDNIETEKNKRISQQTRDDLQTLEETKTLERFAARFEDELKRGEIRPQSVHAWGGLSNFPEIKDMARDFES
jgi:hypothetical protein